MRLLILISFLTLYVLAECQYHQQFLVKRTNEHISDLNFSPPPSPKVDHVSLTNDYKESTAHQVLLTLEEQKQAKKIRRRQILTEAQRKARFTFRDMYENRFNRDYSKEKIAEIESKFDSQKQRESERKHIQGKKVWQRIREGRATEADLRVKERSSKSSKRWREEHKEELREKARSKYHEKKAKKSTANLNEPA